MVIQPLSIDDMFLTSQLKREVPPPSLEPRGRAVLRGRGQQPKKVTLLLDRPSPGFSPLYLFPTGSLSARHLQTSDSVLPLRSQAESSGCQRVNHEGSSVWGGHSTKPGPIQLT